MLLYFGFECVCLCVCMFIRVHVYVEARGQPERVIPQAPSTLVLPFEPGSHYVAWSQALRVPLPPSAEIKGVQHHTWIPS